MHQATFRKMELSPEYEDEIKYSSSNTTLEFQNPLFLYGVFTTYSTRVADTTRPIPHESRRKKAPQPDTETIGKFQ